MRVTKGCNKKLPKQEGKQLFFHVEGIREIKSNGFYSISSTRSHLTVAIHIAFAFVFAADDNDVYSHFHNTNKMKFFSGNIGCMSWLTEHYSPSLVLNISKLNLNETIQKLEV